MPARKSHIEFVAEVRHLLPDVKVIGSYETNATPIRLKTKYGMVRMRPMSILQGSKPNISSAENKTEYFKAQLTEIQPDLEVVGKYKSAHTPIRVQDDFGIVLTPPNRLLNGVGTSIITAEDKTAYFIAKVKAKFPDIKYDYSQAIYVDNVTPITILCPKHGTFEQVPNTHLVGSGCPRCNVGKGEGPGRYNIKRAEKHKAEWQKTEAWLYIIRCFGHSEQFCKVGITTTELSYRFRTKELMPYDYDLVQLVSTNLYDAVYLEQSVLQEKTSYLPGRFFSGYTECYREPA
jgi:hypothetical protein